VIEVRGERLLVNGRAAQYAPIDPRDLARRGLSPLGARVLVPRDRRRAEPI